MVCSILSLISFACGSLAAGFLFRRHYIISEQEFSRQQQEIESRKRALQEIMYRTHHEGINPIAKRIRGLCQLGYLTEDKAEILRFLKVIEDQALTMETDVLNTIKEFEHLQ